MPLFEYVCRSCGHKFEKLSDRWDGRCPRCGAENAERQWSPVSWVYRGLLELIQEEEG